MNGLQQYQQINTQTSITDADPHKLIQLLYQGALERINMAKAKLQAGDYDAKGKLILKVMDIVAALRGFLDKEQGGDLSERLDALYEYMERALWEANARNDVDRLDEVADLLRSIKEGWDGIREEVVAQQQAG
ncbi:flagellar export chaperone FliS [Marinobacter sediminum]|uniref:flagellar export chaperone FliS n=1 Tax=Marinobacter sediminum TaxID=256323 RepID=UPI00202E2460|nr:flagellar export chaperone FliS [Marinobacter sediminum]MCM0612606.1 flagellar export chaperone FliS [Marinobacter sediminum]